MRSALAAVGKRSISRMALGRPVLASALASSHVPVHRRSIIHLPIIGAMGAKVTAAHRCSFDQADAGDWTARAEEDCCRHDRLQSDAAVSLAWTHVVFRWAWCAQSKSSVRWSLQCCHCGQECMQVNTSCLKQGIYNQGTHDYVANGIDQLESSLQVRRRWSAV